MLNARVAGRRCGARHHTPPLRALAEEVGVTPAQLALAWLQQGDVVPIPGTRNPDHLASNLAAADVSLDAETLARIEEAAPADLAAGAALLLLGR